MKGWTGEEEMKARRESKYGPAEEGENKKEEGAAGAAKEEKKEGEPVLSPFEDILTNLASGGGSEYLRNVGNLVAAALDPLGVDVQVDIEHNGKRTNVTQDGEKKKEEKEEEVKEAQEAKEEEEPKKAASPAPSLDSEKDSVEGEEWTVVDKTSNKNEDDGVINIPVQVEGKKEEEEEAVLVDNDKKDEDESVREVPITVSDKPADVLFAAPDGTLYPELPKQEASKVEEEVKGEKEKPRKKEEVKPSAPAAATVSHPDPKIQIALQAMTNMGFSNDGGWLTQLLEAKGGDIGKVLDVLQPVRPVRD